MKLDESLHGLSRILKLGEEELEHLILLVRLSEEIDVVTSSAGRCLVNGARHSEAVNEPVAKDHELRELAREGRLLDLEVSVGVGIGVVSGHLAFVSSLL